MLEFLTVPFNLTPLYFKTFAQVVFEPTDAAQKIARRESLSMSHRAYFVTGLCIISALWGLDAVAYRVSFGQIQVYFILLLYFLVSIEVFAVLLWCAGFRLNPRAYTRRTFMYVAGTFSMAGLFFVELARFIILLPVVFQEAPLCAVRTFECLLKNYAATPYDEFRSIEVSLLGIPSLIGFIYLLHMLIIVQRIHVIRFFFLMVPFFWIEQVLIVPFLILINFIKSYGFM